MNYNIKRYRFRSIILLFSLLCWNVVFAQFKPVKDGTQEANGREWVAMDIGEVYTPSVTSYDDLNDAWKIYGCGLDFARSSGDDIGGTVLTKIPNGDWELIVRVVSPDFVYATGYAYKEIMLDDGTGTGTKKLYYPGEVLAPQPRHTSNQRYGILFRENLNKRCRELTIGSGRRKARQCARAAYEEDEDGNIITDARYTYSGPYRGSTESKNPTWLRIVKRGNNWSTYYAMTNEENNYKSVDEVKWTKKMDFQMELDSANIYAGLFFGSNVNRAFRGSSFEVRDPRVTQTYDNLILREAPPLWQLASPLADVNIPLDSWWEKDITNMFDHDLTDDLNYQIESTDENIAFAYIDKTKAADGSDVRTVKIKGISKGVAKMRIWWDVGGYHLEDVFYVNVVDPMNIEYSGLLLNHLTVGTTTTAIASEDNEEGQIRILCNAGGNNQAYPGKVFTGSSLYYPMAWNGTPDSMEVIYESVNDSRFYHTAGIMLTKDLTTTSAAAGVSQGTTVSGGKGYQTNFHYIRNEGEAALSGGQYPAWKAEGTLTSPNKVLFRTHMKVVRTSDTTVQVSARRDGEDAWLSVEKPIPAFGDYYMLLYQSQTRAGTGSYFSGLKINGEEIQVADQDLSMPVGGKVNIDILGHLGQKLGEDWNNYTIQSSDESKFTASIQDGEFVIEDMQNENSTDIVPINITALKNGEQYSHTLYARVNLEFGMDTVELEIFLEEDTSYSIEGGENDKEFFFKTFQHNLGEQISDECTFLYESIAMEDSSDVTVFINDIENTGETSKSGLMIRADNLTGTKQYVALLVTPEEGLKFQYRWKEGLETVIEDVELEEGVDIELKAPIYLKMRKVGKWFFPYVSKDGATWHIARKYAFPLIMEGENYHTGFSVVTSANFQRPAECHVTEFKITLGTDMDQLYNELPNFKSATIDGEDGLELDLPQYVKIFMGQYNRAVVEFKAYSQGEVRPILYDTYGRTVRTFSPVNLPSGLHRVELNLSEIHGGMYILRVNTPAGLAVEKLIIR